ncbi:MAG: bifunctional 5,10-methylenetetrahydrofolate dehydrogenase/5,10-methenyltetrahydrofolate cyclohydrolase, partial [Candidatus Omnitrophica bacterium]|nr:bifunctional 5,10-methylenetetrahydrofolate dehydrogenase/5,10-methenyltetrahydrofolate cyclohydrolase [Candidatus Omnitrophota bacterium]
MSAILLDGKALAQKIQAELKAEVVSLVSRTGKVPRFMNIVVGADPSAGSYARSQIRAAAEIGVDYQFSNLPQSVTQTELFDHVKLLNDDPDVHGIMIHKPLPKGVDFQVLANYIAVAKDLEGITETNLGKLILGTATIIPCTSAAVMALVAASGVDLKGKDAVVVGRSEIVGKPLMLLLMEKNATVTVCHSG